MRTIPLKKFIPGIAWFFVVLTLICLPGKDIPEVGWLNGIADVDKVIHVTVFGVLGVLFCWPFSHSGFQISQRIRYYIFIALAVSGFGLLTEFIQKFFIPGRSFDLFDWLADSVGAALSLWFCSRKFTKGRN